MSVGGGWQSSAAGDEETSQCLCGAVYFLLKDR